jgi:hypothetical protein
VLHQKRTSAPHATEPENYNLPAISNGSPRDDDSAGEVSDSDFVPSDENASAHDTQLESQQLTLLDHLINEQTETLGARNNPALSNHRRMAGHCSRSDIDAEFSGDSEDDCVGTAESRWRRYLRRLPDDFFSSPEARMQNPRDGGPLGVDDGRRRCVPYVGLSLSHSPVNCPDLLYCYEQIYEMRIQRGGRPDGYSQFKAVSGQLARFAVAAEVVTADTFCSPGGVLQLATNSRLIRAFIGGFQKQAKASTVYSKATLLGSLCKMARQHFGKICAADTPAILSCVDETENLLGAFRRVEKATSRRETAVNRDLDRRDIFISPKDWYILQRRVKDDMVSVYNGVQDLIEQMGRDVHSYMDENDALVRKYALLLLAYVLLTGGGQRPQVYSSLQHPSQDVLDAWENQEGEEVAVKLYPTAEKTPRNTFCPGVMFERIAGHFFGIYAYVVRAAIIRRCGRDESKTQDSNRTFFLHTEKGTCLSGDNLRNSLRLYISNVSGLSGDLSRVTIMTVRASYASVMFRAFRRGKIQGLTLEEFMSELSETMNTSPEMLRTTYIASNGQEFDQAASEFLRVSREE